MEYTFRWFGPHDPSKLDEIRQIGVNGIVTSLAGVKYGEKWTNDLIQKIDQFHSLNPLVCIFYHLLPAHLIKPS